MTPALKTRLGPRFPVLLAVVIAVAARLIVPGVEGRITGTDRIAAEDIRQIDRDSVRFLNGGPPGRP